MQEQRLQIRNLSKTYRVKDLDSGRSPGHESRTVVSSVNLDISGDEIVAIVGKNGSGKSTLLKMMAGITKPDQGSIHYKGRLNAILEIGGGLHPDLSGYENVEIYGGILGFSKEEIAEAMPAILEFSELGDYIHMPVKQYSSGMYLRLAFSTFVHLKTDILLLDEVLSVGDASFRIKCNEKIKELSAKGTCIVFVSHDLNEVLQIASRCILLDEGKVSFDGLPLDAMEEYASRIMAEKQSSNAEMLFNLEEKNQSVTVTEFNINRDSMQVFSDEELSIDLRYVKKNVGEIVYPVLILTDFSQHPVFSASPLFFQQNDLDYLRNESIVSYRCVIPANLLNKGFFTLNLSLFDASFMPLAFESHKLSFKVYHRNEVENSPWKYTAGSIKPVCRWIRVP